MNIPFASFAPVVSLATSRALIAAFIEGVGTVLLRIEIIFCGNLGSIVEGTGIRKSLREPSVGGRWCFRRVCEKGCWG